MKLAFFLVSYSFNSELNISNSSYNVDFKFFLFLPRKTTQQKQKKNHNSDMAIFFC